MRLLDLPALWWLWALPVIVVLLVVANRRAEGAVERFLGGMAKRLVRGRGSHTLRAALMLGAIATSVVALARPAWGVYYEEVHGEGVELVIALDVSRSMLAEDVAPSRLERARNDLTRLVNRVQESGAHRVGFLEFAGVASVRAPLTTDYDFVREQLANAGPHDIARGGTLVGDALRRAVSMLDRPGDHERVVILLTDGEDHESFPLEAAATAADAGVRVFAVGIGDPASGGRIPITDENGNRTFVRHDGREVISRLDEATLRQIAEVTGGGYVPAGVRTIPLEKLYDERIATLDGAAIGTHKERKLHERFQWAVGVALLLVVLSRFAAPRTREDEE